LESASRWLLVRIESWHSESWSSRSPEAHEIATGHERAKPRIFRDASRFVFQSETHRARLPGARAHASLGSHPAAPSLCRAGPRARLYQGSRSILGLDRLEFGLNGALN